MKSLQELQKEIEIARKELNIVAEKDIRTPECYQVSVLLDKLIEDYMQYDEEKFPLQNCG